MTTNSNTQTFYDSLIKTYTDEAFAQAGIASLPEEHQAVLRQELMRELENRLRLVSLEAMDEKSLAEFGEMMEVKPMDIINQIDFFTAHIKDYQDLLERALADFTNDFIKYTQEK